MSAEESSSTKPDDDKWIEGEQAEGEDEENSEEEGKWVEGEEDNEESSEDEKSNEPQKENVVEKPVDDEEKKDVDNENKVQPVIDENTQTIEQKNENVEQQQPETKTPVDKPNVVVQKKELSFRCRSLLEQNQILKQDLLRKQNRTFSSIKNELSGLNGPLSGTLKTAQEISYNVRLLNEQLSTLAETISTSLNDLPPLLRIPENKDKVTVFF